MGRGRGELHPVIDTYELEYLVKHYGKEVIQKAIDSKEFYLTGCARDHWENGSIRETKRPSIEPMEVQGGAKVHVIKKDELLSLIGVYGVDIVEKLLRNGGVELDVIAQKYWNTFEKKGE
jgi:hypothetical protein